MLNRFVCMYRRLMWRSIYHTLFILIVLKNSLTNVSAKLRRSVVGFTIISLTFILLFELLHVVFFFCLFYFMDITCLAVKQNKAINKMFNFTRCDDSSCPIYNSSCFLIEGMIVSNTSTPFYLNFFLSYYRVLVDKSRQDGTSVDIVSKLCPGQLINRSGIILQYYYSKMNTRTPLMNLTLFPATGVPLFFTNPSTYY